MILPYPAVQGSENMMLLGYLPPSLDMHPRWQNRSFTVDDGGWKDHERTQMLEKEVNLLRGSVTSEVLVSQMTR